MSSSSTVTGTLSSPGLGSGLDVNSIVSKLVAVESLPLKVMQSQAAGIQTDISTFGQISSDLSALETAASALRDPTTWKAMTLTSNSPTAITVDDAFTQDRSLARREIIPACDQYTEEAEAFALAVLGHKALPYGIEDAIQNMRILDAILESERSGGWATV